MSDSVFWIIIWTIVISYFVTDSYFDNKTKQIKLKTELEIKKLNNERDEAFRKSVENIVKLANGEVEE